MAGGFARDGAVPDQVDAIIEDGIRHARGQMPKGESRSPCEACGDAKREARRRAVPG